MYSALGYFMHSLYCMQGAILSSFFVNTEGKCSRLSLCILGKDHVTALMALQSTVATLQMQAQLSYLYAWESAFWESSIVKICNLSLCFPLTILKLYSGHQSEQQRKNK